MFEIRIDDQTIIIDDYSQALATARKLYLDNRKEILVEVINVESGNAVVMFLPESEL